MKLVSRAGQTFAARGRDGADNVDFVGVSRSVLPVYYLWFCCQ